MAKDPNRRVDFLLKDEDQRYRLAALMEKKAVDRGAVLNIALKEMADREGIDIQKKQENRKKR